MAVDDKGAKLAGCHDIVDPVFVQILSDDLRTSPRRIMDEFGNKLRAAGSSFVADSSVAVKHRRSIGIRVRRAFLVRVVAFPDDKVRDAISIHVRACRTVRLGEGNASGVLRREVVHNHVLHEGDVPARVLLLFVPRDAERMRL